MSRPDSPLPDDAAAAAAVLHRWMRANHPDDALADALAALDMPAPGSPCDLTDVGTVAAAADRHAGVTTAASIPARLDTPGRPL